MTDMKKLSAELHKRFVSKYPTRHLPNYEKDDVWSADLVDMSEWKDENKDHKFILNVVDCGTRYLFSRGLKDKSANEVVKAFEDIFKKSKRRPRMLWTDEGKEFYNAKMDKLLTSDHVHLYSSYGKHKSFIVERLNRTMKDWMWRVFDAKNNREWLNLLPKLVDKYNSKIHSTLKIAPIDASEIGKFARKMPKEEKKIVFKVGDVVRLSRVKGTFEKSSTANWTRALYRIHKVLATRPTTYQVNDLHDKTLAGGFYNAELQKVDKSIENLNLIEKILERRGNKVLVKWLGYDKSFNSWIPKVHAKEV